MTGDGQGGGGGGLSMGKAVVTVGGVEEEGGELTELGVGSTHSFGSTAELNDHTFHELLPSTERNPPEFSP